MMFSSYGALQQVQIPVFTENSREDPIAIEVDENAVKVALQSPSADIESSTAFTYCTRRSAIIICCHLDRFYLS